MDQAPDGTDFQLFRQVNAIQHPRPTVNVTLARPDRPGLRVEAEIASFQPVSEEGKVTSYDVGFGEFWVLNDAGEKVTRISEAQLTGQDLEILADATIPVMLAPAE